MRKKNSGFTLVELLVTLAVAALMLAWAVPSFKNLLDNNRMATRVNDFVSGINLARTEAIKQGQQGIVCISNNGTGCTGGTDWGVGWLAFVDVDEDGAPDPAEIVRTGEATEGDLDFGGNLDTIAFNPDGTLANVGLGLPALDFCDDRGTAYGRTVALNAAGRPSTTNAAGCP